LGSENRNLPGFVALCAGVPDVGANLWGNAFLPSVHQGTYVPNDEADPEKMIQHLRNATTTLAEQRKTLDFLNKLNGLELAKRGADPLLEGRIQSMEVAYRMQAEAMDAFDIAKEPAKVQAAYGVTRNPDEAEMKIKSATRDGDFARGCLVARRLVERGVRAVQVYFGNDKPWDSHHNILVHRKLAQQADQPIAALLKDLKASGLLKETLVVIGGEFGRRPWIETNGRINVQNGRDHNNEGFTYLLAGAGVKGGTVYGATDEFGGRAVEKRAHVNDLHATILHIMGIDHTRLTYPYSGRFFRLTDVAGHVMTDVLA
jgi:arylsulfatase A-like enzyme